MDFLKPSKNTWYFQQLGAEAIDQMEFSLQGALLSSSVL